MEIALIRLNTCQLKLNICTINKIVRAQEMSKLKTKIPNKK